MCVLRGIYESNGGDVWETEAGETKPRCSLSSFAELPREPQYSMPPMSPCLWEP